MGSRKKIEKQKTIFKSLNKKILVALVISIIGFVGVQMYMTSIIGTSNSAIEQIRIQKDELRKENEIIKSLLDEAKSISSIQDTIEIYNLQEKNIELLEPVNENQTATNLEENQND